MWLRRVLSSRMILRWYYRHTDIHTYIFGITTTVFIWGFYVNELQMTMYSWDNVDWMRHGRCSPPSIQDYLIVEESHISFQRFVSWISHISVKVIMMIRDYNIYVDIQKQKRKKTKASTRVVLMVHLTFSCFNCYSFSKWI